jgi:hypothetical protein
MSTILNFIQLTCWGMSKTAAEAKAAADANAQTEAEAKAAAENAAAQKAAAEAKVVILVKIRNCGPTHTQSFTDT